MFDQILQSRTSRIFFLILLGFIYLALGILKWNYIFNPGIAEGPFLLYRYSKEAQLNYNYTYSDSLRYFLFTPKWISTLIYGNLFLLLNLYVIYVVQRKKIYLMFTFWLFFWVSLLSIVSLLFGYLFNYFNEVYILVARIKELQQSPFTLILLLSAFKINSKD